MAHVVFVIATFVCLHVACDAFYIDRAIRPDQAVQAATGRYTAEQQKKTAPTIIIIKSRGHQQQAFQQSAPVPRVAATNTQRPRNFLRDLYMADHYDLPLMYFPSFGGGDLFGGSVNTNTNANTNTAGTATNNAGAGGMNLWPKFMMMEALDLPFYI